MRLRSAAAAAIAAASTLIASGAPVDVKWQPVTQRLNDAGRSEYVQRFIISGDLARVGRIAFDQFDRAMTALNPADTVGRIIPGYYYIATPRFAAGADSIWVDIVTSGSWNGFSYGADGVHAVDPSGKPFDVTFTTLSATERPEQWILGGKTDRMPYGSKWYGINEALATDYVPGAYDILPSFRSVTLAEGEFAGGKRQESIIKHDNPDFYRLTVAPEAITIEAASPAALKIARRTVDRLLAVNGGKLPAAVIEDWPEFGYRGLMIDVARNFQTLPDMKKLVALMADYRMNRLQFHLIDDEGWRLEIPGLPELTEVGSRRGYTLDEADHLAQIYSGNGNPEQAGGTGSGHYTRAEFIDFLRYCDSLGVAVIPEIETPGHARAMVKAMEARYRRTGDDTYRLREDGDTSKYRSAQDFGDNVINPALPGPYRLMDKVFDEVIAMYKEAGVPLLTIHIGGDEVPAGAWSGSPSAVRFMKEKGFTTEHELHEYWVKAMADALARRGLKMAGWQEIAVDKGEDFARSLAPSIEFVNLWVTWPQKKDEQLPGITAQQRGIPVVLSTAHGFYLDQSYSYHPDERGLPWAKITDEFTSLDAYPAVFAPAQPGGKIVGVQGQLWSETVRGPRWMEHYIFPKALGMVERTWHADTTLTRPQFNRILENHELPYLASRGVNFHLRQPGVKIEGGKALMNSPYANAVIRYTLDGTEPTEQSPVYSGPVTLPASTSQVRARLYYLGKQSVSSIENVR